MSESTGSELRVPLLQDAVLASLRERLVDGTFPPGSQLNIREVAQRLGVSAVPVREAIKILQSEGRLVHERSKGYSVRRLSHEELIQVNRLSGMIEEELLGAGVPKLSRSQIVEMEEAARLVSQPAGDSRRTLEAHQRLHFIPYEAADLSVYLDAVTRLWDHYEHYRLLFYDSDIALKSSAASEHLRFVEACVHGDVEQAIEINRDHRINSFRHVSRIATGLLEDSG